MSVDLIIEGPVAKIVLNRPEKLNALTHEMRAQLRDYAQRLRFDEAVRAIIITGEGRAFCTGADVGRMQRGRRDVEDLGGGLPAAGAGDVRDRPRSRGRAPSSRTETAVGDASGRSSGNGPSGNEHEPGGDPGDRRLQHAADRDRVAERRRAERVHRRRRAPACRP